MLRMQRMGSAGPFNEVYVTEVRSTGPMDIRKATDMVMHQLYEETYRNSAFRGRENIVVVVHNIDVSHGLMYASSARMCDGSCEILKQKTVFNEKEIKQQISKIEDKDKLLLLI